MENQLLITLSRNKLLKNVDISKIDLRNVKGQLITINEGEILFREGDIAEIIYLVISGEINVLKKRLLGKTKSYIFCENDFFGHEEFFEETSRTSTAVALRDSYIIALTRNEIDQLIKLDGEILINLREPVLELDDESLPEENGQDKITSGEKLDEPHWVPSFEDKFIPVEEPKKPATIIQEDNIKPTPGATQFIDESLNIISDKPEDSSKKVKDEIPFFDESASLNEDGIPKAEFELPDFPPRPVHGNKSDEDLNDALFQILSGTNETHYGPKKKSEEISLKENDDAFMSSLNLIEPSVEEKKTPQESTPLKVEPPLENEDYGKLKEPAKESTAASERSDFELENALAEAEKKIKEIEQPETEPAPLPKTKLRNTLTYEAHVEGAMNAGELQMIIQAAELVNSNIRVDEVLKNIIDVATEITNADRGTLYLVDKEKNELWSLITLGDEMREIRLRIGEGLAGFVAKSGETINIKDVQKDPRFSRDSDRASGYKTRNMICFPIKNSKREIIGVLQLLNSANGEFSKRDEEFLVALSIHSAIALQNAELVEKLLQSERIQSLGKMANFLIQDIKKPILVAKRYAEHLRSKQLPPDTAQILNMLQEQIAQVADLVQTTSSYSEGKTLLRAINVSLNNTLIDFKSRVEQFVEGRNSRIVNELDKDVTVKVDVKEFFQCYMHIIKNACDAMPEGGNIRIFTKRDDKKVKISIKDTGLGISEGFVEKIFEPFFTRGKKEGAGLGLSITRKIIEAHNGTINVESTLGNGATFIITLPSASSI